MRRCYVGENTGRDPYFVLNGNVENGIGGNSTDVLVGYEETRSEGDPTYIILGGRYRRKSFLRGRWICERLSWR